jgi:hypothetical protein
MKPVILDASALIASIYEEKGGDMVAKYLPQAIISAVNMTEVISYMVNRGLDVEQVKELLESLTIEVAPYDAEQAFISGEIMLKTKKKGLSLADRACLALAITKNLPVLTVEKAWDELNLKVSIKLIR